ncbi:GGDEF domain-containing protein [Methylobacterium iners]|uniref:diguanylate cyclase n=1 Tax=Methylobacterium iners TaxID=418707 RepID=A0ABQ4RZG3_9HYPH|nr:diguanylate cyclase [Methylobacterium iners]GJD95785.1 Diguanylate cyclase VdcA [Methylobacterium iners]
MSQSNLSEDDCAHKAWQTLQDNSITATPDHYTLMFTYFSDSNAEVSNRLDDLIDQEKPLSAELLSTIHKDCLTENIEADVLRSGSEEIAHAAQQMVDEVSASHGPRAAYGEALDHWASQLNERTTVQDLLEAMTALSLETRKASERNRALERQLSASTQRISKLQQTLVEVKQEAKTCSLTGIPNRKAFEIKLRRSVAQVKADPSNQFCLLMLDVDHFKHFNDTHGHRTGDHVLRLVAGLLSDNIKGKDTAARYGGEEFAILLEGADLQAGKAVARGICERIGKQRLVKRGTGEQVGQITMSIGVAQHLVGESATAIVERADAALYEAKRTGRNKVCLSV